MIVDNFLERLSRSGTVFLYFSSSRCSGDASRVNEGMGWLHSPTLGLLEGFRACG